MDYTAWWSAAKSIFSCLAAQYPALKTLFAGAAAVIGSATILFKAGQTQTAGALNALLPPVLAKPLSWLGNALGSISFSK